jgi:hypothetical protein
LETKESWRQIRKRNEERRKVLLMKATTAEETNKSALE